MYPLLKIFNEKLNEILNVIISTAFGMMTLLIFVQVVFRYVLKESLSWSEELARYLFVWLTFLGAAIATREKAHINVSGLINKIASDKVRKIFITFSNILTMLFLIVLTRYGLQIAIQILNLKQISSSMPFLCIGVVYFAVPIGSFCMITNLIEITIGIWYTSNEIDKEVKE